MTALGTGLLSGPSTTPVTTAEPPCGAAPATLDPPIRLAHSNNITPANNSLFIGFSFLRTPRDRSPRLRSVGRPARQRHLLLLESSLVCCAQTLTCRGVQSCPT